MRDYRLVDCMHTGPSALSVNPFADGLLALDRKPKHLVSKAMLRHTDDSRSLVDDAS